jgi:hypothetical protein
MEGIKEAGMMRNPVEKAMRQEMRLWGGKVEVSCRSLLPRTQMSPVPKHPDQS